MIIRSWVGSKLSTTLLATRLAYLMGTQTRRPRTLLKMSCRCKIRLRNINTSDDSRFAGTWTPFQAHLRVRGPGPDRPVLCPVEYAGISFSRVRRYGYRTRRRKRRRNDCKDIDTSARDGISTRNAKIIYFVPFDLTFLALSLLATRLQVQLSPVLWEVGKRRFVQWRVL